MPAEVLPPTTVSLVITVRNADQSFRDFLASLEAQASLADVESIFVALGDENLLHSVEADVIDSGIPSLVLHHPSADIAAARRYAISRASGQWVTFPDGQDALGVGYATGLVAAIKTHSAAVQAFVIGTGAIGKTAKHGPTQLHLRDLDDALVELSSDITRLALPRRDVPSSGRAIADVTDELLLIDLLVGGPPPRRVAVMDGALYLKRKRPAPDPQTELSRSDAAHYFALTADIAARVERDEASDGWRHQLAIRLIKRLVDFENTTTKRATALHDADGIRFRGELRSLLHGFDDRLFRLRNLPDGFDERRDTLLALSGRPVGAKRAYVIKADASDQLMEVRHSDRFGATPGFSLGETSVKPRYGKRRRVEAFGVPVFEQIIAWVPASGRTRLQVDGTEVAICYSDGERLAPDDDALSIESWRDRRLGVRQRQKPIKGMYARARSAIKSARRSWLSRAAAVRLLSHAPWIRRNYRDAWLLMDRADMGRDNAEHFYRWLSQTHPEINAWFVLRSDSADFDRLRGEGFRMVEYGSLRHQLLLNNTSQYLSSHVGIDVSRPIFDRYLQQRAPWTFTFLQHGVIHNDLSTWLNRQSIRIFLTSTHGEFNSLSGESPYVFTQREMRLTGLPRFDKLRRIADATSRNDRKTIVIAPTWRNSLFLPPERTGELRKPRAGFLQSSFIQSLLRVLNDERLRRLSDDGYVIRFVPHPNLAAHFPYAEVPPFVSVTTYAETDVQELIGGAAVFLTDYSSVAFDAAFAEAAVVYMHLDGGAIYGQDHTLFPGYFDFERDGFGPICHTIDATIDAVVGAVYGNAPPEYAQRAREAFAYWDSGACERVYDVVTSLAYASTKEGKK